MTYRIVGIGEILWDVFPDGPRFGGAPANFSCSAAELAQSAARVQMVSAVGDDQLGRAAINSLQQRGVDTSAVQIDQRATGQVIVELDAAGVASYRFAENSAWDHVTWNEDLNAIAAGCDAVCFGTLGQRSGPSRATIQSFLKATPETALRILDVNLREPFYSDDLILESLELANILKLNDDELPHVARRCDCTGNPVDLMQQLARKYQLQFVAVTRGPDGAIIASSDSVSERPGIAVDVADTVGAGDAFTASMTLDLLLGQSLDVVNCNAIEAASYVCSRPGATMPFPEHLQRNRSA